MRKKAVIVVSLVEESAEVSNEKIKKEILEDLPRIAWCKEIEKITITEA